MVNETMDMSLMFKTGPKVSLKGSPMVSPTMHAFSWSVFLIYSFSQSSFDLSPGAVRR